ncbi:50S ribosome-binding GTPase [Calothrix sp. FACHB-1219]|uniref:FeoB small GTPase domain-containing protein n=1 Tax=unclassified Calothrix TaxID=2619626 RepID=UPI00168965C0|nr:MULTISPECIES: FeoB small GTPase domain-containing protein [unclassified Calothrix]MBD2208067.1 50S ribosome-binding GTPase [Calothrix sp. FACHB-168]MBD2217207.1 50S ribosome-binding GTPase [Calothrix sp. FACHB-1219]
MECHQCKSQGKSCGGKSRGLAFFRKKQPLLDTETSTIPPIALVGMPNVGKSVLFNALTGIYVTVSNYPGTTVEVSRGLAQIGEQIITVIDTPGMYSLLPISEEEKVARDLLLSEPVSVVIHVVDAKNLGRMLSLTFQLIEAGLPVILAVNMMDEAHRWGLDLRQDSLEMELEIPVVCMSAALNQGIDELRHRISPFLPVQTAMIPV